MIISYYIRKSIELRVLTTTLTNIFHVYLVEKVISIIITKSIASCVYCLASG